MIYKNKRTGNIIDVPCEVMGGDWEIEKTSPKTTKKKAVKEDDRAVCDDK